MPFSPRSRTPRVSVITINGGRDVHLARLLEGLHRGDAPDECIVVEMGGSVRTDDGFVRRIPLPEPGLKLAAARNAGRHAATGDILIFLDVDCIPSADLVTSLTSAVAEHDGLICCEVSYLPAEAVDDDWFEAKLMALGHVHPARIFPRAGVVEAPQPGLLWTLAFAVRATTFDRIGGFDDGFSGYGAEDTDFAFRAADMSVPVLFSAAGRAFHQRHASFDPPLQHFADIVQNAARFRKRHNFWPMEDWLKSFAAMGLITLSAEAITILRTPTASEIDAASIPPTRPF